MLNFNFKMISIFLFVLMMSTSSIAQQKDAQEREDRYIYRIISELEAGTHPDSIYEGGSDTALTVAVKYAMKSYADFIGWSGVIEDLLEAGADP